jgi:hypothetical protein
MFLDSNTKISPISLARFDIEQDWFLTNEQMADARKKINDEARMRRVFCHMICQSSPIRYFAMIVPMRLSAFSAATCGVMPSRITSASAAPQICCAFASA